ncbi:glycosyl hydrolase [Mucilaginibacter sabulilitoris]|uniref:Glycosyl hydrolase n=1 Tax=Mucilaginibacter sabulilitoris TaxID=1173583 RepID=A0ABZ0THT8_9SPHI|nr:glycosyl hydrolase [Mucilaginibacter sabulilitoris]WPU92364.1 glycosyl hydrolase [Mucilaginibacter sabulilitoris]
MRKFTFILTLCVSCLVLQVTAQVRSVSRSKDELKQAFLHPPESAKPWVFWYWMQAAVTREGITADLQAMKQAGIGGAYLMPIKGVANPPYLTPAIEQLTPQWWAMVKFAMQEADRIGVKLAMHDCDGFALAGGPWITPELSMQKVVWSKTLVIGGRTYQDTLPKPAHYKNYYKDIEVLAYPSLPGEGTSSYDARPKVTTSIVGTDLQYLAENGNKKSFATNEPCWIQLEFEKPFTCRSLVIHTTASNYQSERLQVEVSDDGRIFRSLGKLQPPRHGWQDGDAEITNEIVPTTSRYFRFVYDKTGSEPGAEDLDFAKWKPSLKLSGIELSAEPRIHQYESKTGEVWRISKRTTITQLPQELCIPKDKIINLTNELDANGRLNWNVPAGQWTILRIGHTSTGHTNATGGAGNGLECDKFNPEAAKVQFDHWFGEAVRQAGPELAKKVLKIFHIDSWECGSQNWSPVFAAEFKKRRGYDLLPYLPVMAGIPVQSAGESEKVLSDVRETIAELLVDNFYGTMAKLAYEKGCTFTAESVAPTMMSDGMLHYQLADVPMGEFWFRSPTHDKPNDMLDAISGGHIYGKNIIQAEAFTELRLLWDEHPAMLKAMADLNFALGINRYVFHVNVHNPWLDRKPGMTLDGIGMFFQRDQTWWKPGKAWFDYIQRCQALLQQGHPVTDIAVFTGEETPRRAILPDRLVNTLPGIFGAEMVAQEKERLANKGEPIVNSISDASHSANMALPENWTDPLRGYAYDSFNRDALLRLATVKNGRITLPGGASYAMLVIPGAHAMSPDSGLTSPEVVKRLQELVNEGATVLINNQPMRAPGMADDATVAKEGKRLLSNAAQKGKVIIGPYQKDTFDELGVARDFTAQENDKKAKDIAWAHRRSSDFELYFISNQQAAERTLDISLRSAGFVPELWDALTGEIHAVNQWQSKNGRTMLPVHLAPNGSVFIVLREKAVASGIAKGKNWSVQIPVQTLTGAWKVQFNPKYAGPEKAVIFDQLEDWSKREENNIKYYSGTASYSQSFTWNNIAKSGIWLDLGSVENLAEVYVNGINCGVAWAYPYQVNISKALKKGVNRLKIEVSNTWANRLMGDHALPEKERVTWTNAVYRLEGRSLLPAGLLGPVKIISLRD